MKRLIENLKRCEENHILPFFWQHGESEQTLRTYMEKINATGIQAVCVEARPHPDFVGDKWWKDMDIILEEAKQRDMKVWILDDAHFPSGFANGAIRDKYPQYRKRFLKLHQLDFAGPCKYAQAMISYAFEDKEDYLEGVYLAKKAGFEAVDADTIIDITEGVQDNDIVNFELPEGAWKLLILVSTYKGGEPHTEDYLNPLVPEATDVLLEAVYEPHYLHYKEEFGETILGFFSDEPRFGNMHGSEGSIGRCPMVLPWRDDLTELLRVHIEEKGGQMAEVHLLLPLLFVDGGMAAHQIRYFYMDLVSELFSENFSNRIGTWCEEHGVEYIGHGIEDNNAHARLGYGAGHFFKSMRGQHMAGIDVVLHQLLPGLDHMINKSMTSKGWDGEFFHYVLGKLGASLGHLEKKKQGRVMCELFGAYGWAEGNRFMKWMTDFMLVRGVNEFVPHAFDPKAYPDSDCPPHFYAHGKNPQFQEFGILMKYMNRLAHLLSGGIHRAPVAVGYHGEAEWSGDYMLMQKPCAELTRNQIDFDICPPEAVVESQTGNGIFQINQETFRALVVPYAEALPLNYLYKIAELSKAGVRIYVLEKLPMRSSEGIDASDVLKTLQAEPNIKVINLESLVKELWNDSIYEVKSSEYEPYLRYYHYEHKDGHVLMVVNEAPGGVIQTELEIPFGKGAYQYDAFENKLTRIQMPQDGSLEITLNAYESAVYCWPKKNTEAMSEFSVEKKDWDSRKVWRAKLSEPYLVSFAAQEEYPVFSENFVMKKLVPMQQIPGKESFVGVIRYETEFYLDKKAETAILLDTVYESARVSVNNSGEKVRICPPYRFDVTNAVHTGRNTLVVEVTTTLVRERMDWLSQFMLLEPTGITDDIWIEQCTITEL